VIVVGAGNIGAAAIDALARMRSLVRYITVIDCDVYTPANLVGQAILERDVGRPKAVVQKRRILRIDHAMRGRVSAVVDDVRNLPVGRMRADVILSCLDSKSARRYVVQTAWRLNVPVIDAGVNATEGLLARVTVYLPGADGACIECGWDDVQYETLEQTVPCLADDATSAPTGAPLSLGMLAASLQVIECGKLLSGDGGAAGTREILIDAANHRYYLSMLRRNPNCRFDHAIWTVRSLDRHPSQVTVADLLRLGDVGPRGGSLSLRLEGRPFVRKTQCSTCGAIRDVLRLSGRLRPRDRRCQDCGGTMTPMGFFMTDRLDLSGGSPGTGSSLSVLGLMPQDVVALEQPCGEQAHYELGDRR